MTMDGHRVRGGLLRPTQVAALREALCADLSHYTHWADLWNLHGLLEAWEGNLETAANSLEF